MLLALIVLVASTEALPQSDVIRVEQGLQALYTFDEGGGSTIYDVSGVAPLVDLQIENVNNVSWGAGVLEFTSPTIAKSSNVATKLNNSIKVSNAVTVEAWVKPANTTQTGPAEIVTLSDSRYQRNVGMGQGLGLSSSNGTFFNFRLRSQHTGNQGNNPSLSTPNGSATTELTHLVLTREPGGTTKAYVNGVEVASGAAGGSFSNWRTNAKLAIGREIRPANRHWLGSYDLVAFYDRALSATEVSQNFAAGNTAGNSNFAPIAVDDEFTIEKSSVLQANVLSDNGYGVDSDAESSQIVVSSVNDSAVAVGQQITLASGALLTLNTSGEFSYDPNSWFDDLQSGESAQDSFVYSISDGERDSAIATVNITLEGADTPNQLPVAQDDFFTVSEDATLTGNLLSDNGNGVDYDPDSGLVSTLAINGVEIESGQTISLGSGALLTADEDGGFAYNPAGSFDYLDEGEPGQDNFGYSIQDNRAGVASATAFISVSGRSGSNAAPLARDDQYFISAYSVLSTNVFNDNGNGVDVDPDGDPISVVALNGDSNLVGNAQAVTISSGATVSLSANGELVYDASNLIYQLAGGEQFVDSFMYSIADNRLGSASAFIQVTITGLDTLPRVEQGLQALYTFDEGGGSTIFDVSGVAPSIDLQIENVNNVSWGAGVLEFTSPTIAKSSDAATKLNSSIKASKAITVEAWIKPANTTQTGPAEIVTLSDSRYQRNVGMGQGLGLSSSNGTFFNIRLRSQHTGNQGNNPSLSTPNGSATTELIHLVLTRAPSGTTKAYVNGLEVGSGVAGGTFANWRSNAKLAIGREIRPATRHWLGSYELVAFYDRALSATEVNQNFAAGNAGVSGPDLDPPTVPASLQSPVITDTEITLAWGASTDTGSGIAGYRVLRGTTVLGTITDTTITDTGLDAGTDYDYSVIAIDDSAAANESDAATLSVTTDPAPDNEPPTVPANLQAPTKSDTTITLTWDASTDVGSNVAGYRVLRGTTVLGTVTGTTITDTGLDAFTGYVYSVIAIDDSDSANESDAAILNVTTEPVPDTEPPTVPANLQAPTKSDTTITLTWDASTDVGSNVAGYRVLRGTTDIGTVTDTTITDTGLDAGTDYSYSVIAMDDSAAANESGAATLSVTTEPAPDTEPPTVPTNLKAPTKTDTTITLTWDASTDVGSNVAGYRVLRGTTDIGTVTETTITDTGLSALTEYTYSVKAIDDSDAANESDAAILNVTTEPAPDTEPPTVPTNLQAPTKTDTEITLIWDASTDVGSNVAGYRVLRGTTVLGTITETTITDTGLVALTEYIYSVIAIDDSDAANESDAAILNVTTEPAPDTEPPTVPTNLQAPIKSDTEITLTWNASTDTGSGVAGYRVLRGTTVLGTVTDTAIADTGLDAGTDYIYSVIAIDDSAAANESDAAILSVTTDPAPDNEPPTVLANLQAPIKSDTEITLTWNASTDTGSGVAGYRVLRGTTVLGTITDTTITDTGLVALTEYTYSVIAIDDSDAANESDAATLIVTTEPAPDTEPPSVPTNLVAPTNTDTAITLTWDASTDISGIAGYRVLRGTTVLGTVTDTTITDTGLDAGTDYIYSVIAIDDSDAANESDAATLSVTTDSAPDTEPPTVPTNLQAPTKTDTAITLTWDASTDISGIAGYRVLRGTTEIGTVTESTITDTGLDAGTDYSYSVIAIDDSAAANESDAAILNVTTEPAPDTEPPTVPTNLQAPIKSDTEITLTWNASTDTGSGVAGYRVLRGTTVLGTVTDTTIADTGLDAGTDYIYSVIAIDDSVAANESDAATLSVTTDSAPDTEPPTVPTNLQAPTKTDTAITLTWDASTDISGIAGYRVLRGTTDLGTVTDTTITDTGLDAGTDYIYSVIAIDDSDAANESDAAALTVTTDSEPDTEPPTVPTNLQAPTKSDTEITLTWDASIDTGSGVAGYRVLRGTTVLGTIADTTITDTGLVALTEYTYSVIAIDDSEATNESAAATLSVTTESEPDTEPPNVPTNLQAPTKSDTEITLTWDASTDTGSGIAGYRVLRGTTVLGTITDTTITDSGLDAGADYIYSVIAIDDSEAANESDAATVSVTTEPAPDNEPPTVPANLQAPTKTDTEISLTWDASTDAGSGIAGYRVLRGTTVLGTITDTTITDTGLDALTEYTYSVIAIDDSEAANESDAATLSVTTDPASDTEPPTVPTNFQGMSSSLFDYGTCIDPLLSGSLSFQNLYMIGDSIANSPTFINTVTSDLGDRGISLVGEHTVPGMNIREATDLINQSKNAQSSISQADIVYVVLGVNNWSLAHNDLAKLHTHIDNFISTVRSNNPDVLILWHEPYGHAPLVQYPEISTGSEIVGSYLRGKDDANDICLIPWHDMATADPTIYLTARITDGVHMYDNEADFAVPVISYIDAFLLGTSYEVALTWDASTDDESDVAGYRVNRDGVVLGVTSETFFTDTLLSANTAYLYSLVAIDSADPANETIAAMLSITTELVPDFDPPSIPANLQSSNKSDTEITLTWDASTDIGSGIAGYRVLRGTTVLGTISDTTITDSGLDAGTDYIYSVIAIDDSDVANESDAAILNVTTEPAPDTEPPTVPANLQAPTKSDTAITLTWDASTDVGSNVAGYRVLRGTTVLGTITDTTITDTGLDALTDYIYSVIAIDDSDAANESDAAILNVTTEPAPDTEPPTVPANLQAPTKSDTAITLTWDASTDVGSNVAGYRVLRGTTVLGTITDTTITDTGLDALTDYLYSVIAIDDSEAANESAAATLSVTTEPAPDTEPPTVPTNLQAPTKSDTAITLTWDASTDISGIAGYRVLRGTTVLGTISDTTITDSGLDAGTDYIYSVIAIDDSDVANESDAAILNVTTEPAPDTEPPTVPANLQAPTKSDTAITLSWGASTDAASDIAGYRVLRGTTILGTITDTTITDTGLDALTDYLYSVIAIDDSEAANESDAAILNVTTESAPDTEPPTVPANLQAPTKSDTAITLTWDASTDVGSNVAGYRVLRGTTVLGTITDTTITDTGLDALTDYLYSVIAIDDSDAANESDAAILNVTTEPAPDTEPPTVPANLQAPTKSDTAITLTWDASTDVGSNVAGYRVLRGTTVLGTITDTTITDTGLDALTDYLYSVIAIDDSDAANESDAAILNVTTEPAPDTEPPTVPANLQAPTKSDTAITLTWDASTDVGSNVAGYRVLRGTTVLGTITDTTITDTGLDALTDYLYSVIAIDDSEAANESAAATLSVTTEPAPDTEPPTVPANLQAPTKSDTAITLTWDASTDISGIAGYRVLRGTTVLGTISDTTITDSGLDAGTDYIYSVIAIDDSDAANESDAAILNVTTEPAPDTEPPTVPANLQSPSKSHTEITLTWSASTDVGSGVAGYRVLRGGGEVGTTTETEFTNTGLNANVEYAYSVVAFDGANPVNESTSATLSVTTDLAPDTEPPTVPANLQAPTKSDTAITLIWDASIDAASDIAGYRVLRGTTVLGTVIDTTITDTGLDALTGYNYSVIAIDDSEDANESTAATLSVTTDPATDTEPPTVPTNLQAPSKSDTEITLVWDVSTDVGSNVAGYRVLRGTTVLGAITDTTITDSGLVALTEYTYSVVAIDDSAAANESGAATLSVTTDPAPDTEPPTVPTNLQAPIKSDIAITLIWDASIDAASDIAGYRVLRGTTVLGTVTDTTITDSGLVALTEYTYSVIAIDDSDAGNESTAATLTVSTEPLPDTEPPTVPTNLQAPIKSDIAITLIWDASTDAGSGIAGYRVLQGTTVLDIASETTFTDTGLDAITEYTYSVIAIDDSAAANESAAATLIVTTEPAPDTEPPTVPANLQAPTKSDTAITLSWDGSTDAASDIAGYRVLRGTTVLGTISDTTITDSGLDAGTDYIYSVIAIDDSAAANESDAATLIVTTEPASDTEPPTVPTNLQALTISDTEVTLTWDASTDASSDIAGYRILQGTTVLDTITETTFTDTGLDAITDYIYSVIAIDDSAAANESDAATLIVTTEPASDTEPPTVPTNLQAPTISDTEVTLTWDASTDASSDIAGYRILQGMTVLDTITETTFTDTGLDAITEYTYSVIAIDDSEAANESDAVTLSVTTEPAPDTEPPTVPTNLQVPAKTDTEITLTWDASSDVGSGVASYRVLQGTTDMGLISETTFTDTGLSAETEYTYSVSAIDSSAQSNESAPITLSVVTNTESGEPTLVPRFEDAQTIYSGGATTVQWGDIDGDGDMDMFASEGGRHHNGTPTLSWFEFPGWTKREIGTPLTPYTGDSQLVDMDADGDLDIVISVDSHSSENNTGILYWYENINSLTLDWPRHIIEENIPDAYHIGDIAVGDVDANGFVDVAIRHLSTRRFVIYFQTSANTWQAVRMNTKHREGMALADLNDDGLLDIIGNGFVRYAPPSPITDTWPPITIIDPNYYNKPTVFLNNSVKVGTTDFNGDGKTDVVFSSAEGEAVYFRLV